jgi:hypothetical protein
MAGSQAYFCQQNQSGPGSSKTGKNTAFALAITFNTRLAGNTAGLNKSKLAVKKPLKNQLLLS